MFDPHNITPTNSNYFLKKGQIIQKKVTQKEIFYNIEEIKKYIPVKINNGLLDQFIFRLKIHNLRMMVNNGRYLETFNILSFTSPPFTIPNFR